MDSLEFEIPFVEIDGNGYKALWVGRDGGYEVHDPMKKSWTHLGSMPSLSSYHCH